MSDHIPSWDHLPDELYDEQHDRQNNQEAAMDTGDLAAPVTLILPEEDPTLPPEQQAWREVWRDRFKGDELSIWLTTREAALAQFGPRPAQSLASAPWPPIPMTARFTFTGTSRARE